MDKKVLSDYMDICELISETEEEIRNLERTATADSTRMEFKRFL